MTLTCRRCLHTWTTRFQRKPKVCPRCKQDWTQPLTYPQRRAKKWGKRRVRT